MSYRDRKRKPIEEINVVPYIDVMLVLLIILLIRRIERESLMGTL